MNKQCVKLSPEGAMEYWDEIAPHIMRALPAYVTYAPHVALKIQEKVLLGSLQCWVGLENENVCILATTLISVDPISEEKSFVLYTVASVTKHSQDLWFFCLNRLREYAKTRECSCIIAYSRNPRAISLAHRLNADVSQCLLRFEV